MKIFKKLILKLMINSYKEIELSSYVLHLNIQDSHIEYQTKYVSCSCETVIREFKNDGVYIDSLWINSNVIESIELIEVHRKTVFLDYFNTDSYNCTEEEIKELNDKYNNIVNQYNILKGDK